MAALKDTTITGTLAVSGAITSDAAPATDNAVVRKLELTAHTGDRSNPHGVTKAQVGLGSVTNDAQVKRSEMGANSGVATLGVDGRVPAGQLPSALSGGAPLMAGSNVGSNPKDLTWQQIRRSSPFLLLDPQFIHCSSVFSFGDVGEWSGGVSIASGIASVSAEAETIEGPKSAWFAVEACVVKADGCLGVGVSSGSHKVFGSIDTTAATAVISVDGSAVQTQSVTLSLPVVLTLLVQGNTLSLWADGRMLCATSSSIDLKSTAVITGMKYALTTATGGAVATFRAGASGGVGLLNFRVVTYLNGDAVWLDSRHVLASADYTAVGTGQTYHDAQSNIFVMDVDNFTLVSVAKICNQTSTHILGGQDIKLSVSSEDGSVYLAYNPCDDATVTAPAHRDLYTVLPSVPYGEWVIPASAFSEFGLTGVTTTVYDIALRKIGATWYLGGTEYVGVGRPILFSGASLGALTLVGRYTSGGEFLECTSTIKSGGALYWSWSSFDQARTRVFDGSLSLLGMLQFPSKTTGVPPAWQVIPLQRFGKTRWLGLTFDGDFPSPALPDGSEPVSGTSYNNGSLVVHQSSQVQTGYDSDVRITRDAPILHASVLPFLILRSLESGGGGGDLLAGLTHLWPLSADANDTIGSVDLDGTVTYAGGVAVFNGTTNKLSASGLYDGAGSFSLAMKVLCNDNGPYTTLAVKGVGTVFWKIYTGGGGRVNFYVSDGTATGNVASPGGIQDGVVHKVVATFSADTGAMRLYLDGGAHTASFEGTMPSDSSGTNFGVDETGAAQFLSGSISDVRFWNRVLSADEVSSY